MIQINLNTILGRVVSFCVALIRDDECITRYDTAHGCVHRDVLGKKNAPAVINKLWYPSLTYSQGFRYAREDLLVTYREYYEHYRTH